MSARRRSRTGALLLCAAVLGAAAGADAGAVSSEKSADELRREIARLRGLQARYSSAERSVLGELDEIARESLLAARELELARAREQEGQRELTRLAAVEQQLAERLERSRLGLKRALLAAYRRQTPPELWALVAGEEPLDVTRDLRRIAAVGTAHQSSIQEYEVARAELVRARAELAGRTAEQARIREEAETRRSAADAARARKGEFLRTLASRRNEAALELRGLGAELAATFGSLEAAPAPFAATGFATRRGRLPWPVEGVVTARFGNQMHPRFHTLVEHPGIALRAAAGAPVRAVHAGDVAWADWFKGYGLLVILAHGDGYYTLYAQLAEIAVARGARVAAGALIGRAGDSGAADEPGLYFELRRGDRAENPEPWLERRAAR